ncbi:hypothetical protein [Acetobacterium sp. K1/6]|jgi:hypothetical protein|nr:hypothetical protein [Acetobacterium sp. K1/6]MDZ5723586.1 hypothetical protein [Acetobacterium sp. K1/6]
MESKIIKKSEVSMKIIAIMGSPHKGKGLEIVQKIEVELSRLAEIEIEIL